MKTINFSIIIPHKNIPNLLQRCLDSIPFREDIQIIIVDDNSNPAIVDFAHFPGRLSPNIEVYFTKEGKGAGYARNVGLSHAQGRWLLFADADDFFLDGAFDYLSNYINNPHHIVFFKTQSCYSDSLKKTDRGDIYNQLIDNYSTAKIDAEEWLRYRYYPPWGKLINAELIITNSINFDETIASEDVMFSLRSGYYAKSIEVIDSALYCVTAREGSLTNTVSYEMLLARYIVVLTYNQFLVQHGKGRFRTVYVLYYLCISLKYGILCFSHFVKLAIEYKINPLLGLNRWIVSYLSNRKRLS